MCAVVENYEDRNMFNLRKENKTCCINKYKLISTINQIDDNLSIEKLNKLNEVNLIDIVTNMHITHPTEYTQLGIESKQDLIKENKVIYDTHIKAIIDKSKQEFSELLDEFQKTSGEKYRINFSKE